jgi:hypothetical protein
MSGKSGKRKWLTTNYLIKLIFFDKGGINISPFLISSFRKDSNFK